MNSNQIERATKHALIEDMARYSNPELGAIDNTLVNYYTGNINATF